MSGKSNNDRTDSVNFPKSNEEQERAAKVSTNTRK